MAGHGSEKLHAGYGTQTASNSGHTAAKRENGGWEPWLRHAGLTHRLKRYGLLGLGCAGYGSAMSSTMPTT
eukprot:2893730-Rhodomonas_salina.5